MKAYLNFTNNALSKVGYLKAVWKILTFQSAKNYQKCMDLVGEFFNVSSKQVFLFGGGRMAVYSLLKHLSLKEDDEVIVAGYTCVVLTNAVKFSGAKIAYVDVDLHSGNMLQEALFSSIHERSKVLIIPHNFGIVSSLIPEIKERFPQLYIIEDVAHSFGSKDAQQQLAGTLGHAAFFSLEYSKPITSGIGGLLIVNELHDFNRFKANYEALNYFPRSYVFKIIVTLGALNLTYFSNTTFFLKNTFRILSKLKWVYNTSKMEIDGFLPPHYPVKLSKVLSNFLVIQLEHIHTINEKKKQIVASYQSTFHAFNDLITIPTNDLILVRYPLLFGPQITNDQIKQIQKEAYEKGYTFGVWFNDVVHPIGSYRYGYEAGACENGEYLSKRMLNLPVNINYPLHDGQLNDLVQLLKKYGVQ